MKLLPFSLDQNDELSVWRAKTFWDKEPETLSWINYWANFTSSQKINFIDVGANIGIYTLYAASLNKFEIIYAIEPMPSTYKLLKKNISLNNFQNIVPVNSPAFSVQKNLSFIYNDTRVGSSGGRVSTETTSKKSRKENTVTTITGDTLLMNSSNQLIIKIDVDGDELEVLHGFQDSMKNGKVLSVLVEAEPKLELKVINLLASHDLRPHKKLNDIPLHSTIRRKKNANPVRNLIFSQGSYLS